MSASSSADFQASFVGVAGCAAMACHGGTRPNERREYTTWIERDRHARAFLVLYEKRSLRIARNLGIDRPDNDVRCLSCHTTTNAARGPKFSVEDGVGCEACHGAAERWLVPHTKADWKAKPAEQKYGSWGMMTDTKNLQTRAAVCVKCHVGEPGREVNHDLIAAGHPQLIFELDAYTANMPPHWREMPDKRATGAQAWAVGQAVSLRQSLELLADRAKRGQWPEFAEFDCYACHHELRDNSWRQQVGYGDRRPGSPVWSNPQLLLTMRGIASAGQHADEYRELCRLLGEVQSPASEVAAAAQKAAAAAAALVDQLTHERWDRDRLHRLLADLSAELPAGSLDYATAAYTTMALGAVFEAIARSDTKSGALDTQWLGNVRAQLDRLYDDVREGSLFDAPTFSMDLNALRNAVQR